MTSYVKPSELLAMVLIKNAQDVSTNGPTLEPTPDYPDNKAMFTPPNKPASVVNPVRYPGTNPSIGAHTNSGYISNTSPERLFGTLRGLDLRRSPVFSNVPNEAELLARVNNDPVQGDYFRRILKEVSYDLGNQLSPEQLAIIRNTVGRYDPAKRVVNTPEEHARLTSPYHGDESNLLASIAETAYGLKNGITPSELTHGAEPTSWVYDHIQKYGPQFTGNTEQDTIDWMSKIRGNTPLGEQFDAWKRANGLPTAGEKPSTEVPPTQPSPAPTMPQSDDIDPHAVASR